MGVHSESGNVGTSQYTQGIEVGMASVAIAVKHSKVTHCKEVEQCQE